MGWQLLHTWSRRIVPLGLGVLLGAAMPGRYRAEVIALTILLVLTLGTVYSFTSPAPDEPVSGAHARRLARARRALAEADAILAQATARADEIRQEAEQDAAETASTAELQARAIVDRARTIAAALDPAAEHEPRIRPPRKHRGATG